MAICVAPIRNTTHVEHSESELVRPRNRSQIGAAGQMATSQGPFEPRLLRKLAFSLSHRGCLKMFESDCPSATPLTRSPVVIGIGPLLWASTSRWITAIRFSPLMSMVPFPGTNRVAMFSPLRASSTAWPPRANNRCRRNTDLSLSATKVISGLSLSI